MSGEKQDNASPIIVPRPKKYSDTDYRSPRDDSVFLTQKGGALFEFENKRHIKAAQELLGHKEHESTVLLRRRKELREYQQLLDERRQRFRQSCALWAQKREDLQSRSRQLKERVQNFEKHLHENDAKRQRALAKAQSERRVRELKEQEQQTLNDTLLTETLRAERVRRQIMTHRQFEAFLAYVLASLPHGYLDSQEPHINDILQRHQTLSETRDDLQGTRDGQQEEIEREAARLSDLIKLKSDRVLVCNSKLGVLQKRLDKAKTETSRIEAVIGESAQSGKQRMRMISEVKLAINNIHNRLVEKSAKPLHSLAASSAGAASATGTIQSSGAAAAAQGAANASGLQGAGRHSAIDDASQGGGSGRTPSSRVVSAMGAALASGDYNSVATAATPAAGSVAGQSAPAGAATQPSVGAAVKEPTLQEKLSAISDRIVDLSHIHAKVEALLRDERNRRKSTRYATAPLQTAAIAIATPLQLLPAQAPSAAAATAPQHGSSSPAASHETGGSAASGSTASGHRASTSGGSHR